MRLVPALSLFVVMAAGCPPAASPAAADRARYRAALSDRGARTPAERVTDCGAISAPSLRGDCIVGVMALTGARDPSHCAGVPPGTPWRDECWFTAADDPDQPLEVRWARCGQAGAYAPDCWQHQREREAAVIGASDAPVADKVAAVEALIARDAASGPGDPFRTRYALWLGDAQGRGRVAPEVCRQAPRVAQADCVRSLGDLVAQRVRRGVRRSPDGCRAPDLDLGALLPRGVDPSLDRMVARALEEACTGGASVAPGG